MMTQIVMMVEKIDDHGGTEIQHREVIIDFLYVCADSRCFFIRNSTKKLQRIKTKQQGNTNQTSPTKTSNTEAFSSG